MKTFKKLIIFAIIFALSLSAFACSDQGLKGIAQDLTTYTIDMTLNDEQKTMEVKQTVDFVNGYDIELHNLYFKLHPNAYREGARFSPISPQDEIDAYPNGKSWGNIKINSLKLNSKDIAVDIGGQDDDILMVNFDQFLMPTDKAKIEMTYTLTIPNVRHRYGYYDKNINLGNFYPIACVYENGEFDSSPYYSHGDPFYSQVANYKVSVTAPKNYTAAMSGLVSATETANERRSFATTLAMRDFAVILGEFKQHSGTADGVGVTYYYYDESNLSPADALTSSLDSIKVFNEMFGKYPYQTLAVVQTHFLNGGMEYPGLVYISDRQKGEIYRDVIIHEIAHQWWYAVVGNNQITNAWLDETLAEYSATLFYQRMPGYKVDYSKRIADALKTYALYCDLFGADLDTSMTRKLPEFRTSLEYSIMAYTKGQVMMDSLRKTIGDEAFFEGLRNYYKNNYLKIARPEHLIASFENACKRDLQSFFSTWLDGKVLTFGKS